MQPQMMRRSLTSDSTDARVGSRLLYLAGIVLFVLGIITIGTRPSGDSQIVLGLLATICTSLQLVVLGLLVDVRGRLRSGDGSERGEQVN